MRLVLASYRLAAPGGSETYLLTVAEQLARLGHDVVLHAVELGDMSDFAVERGLRVAAAEGELPASADAVLTQDGFTSHALAQRFPGAPQVFVAHEAWDTWLLNVPPWEPQRVVAVVTMNERVRRRVNALAGEFDIVRLRQPIDTRRFRVAPISARARKLLALSNYLDGERLEMMERACGALDLDFEHVGELGSSSPTVEDALHRADIVVGQGRSALEAMAAGRAVYVFDQSGADGWVTPERYPAMEAAGFAAGAALNRVIPAGVLQEELADYSAAMGRANRDLVHHQHYAGAHAHRLVELWRDAGARDRSGGGPAWEMARLVRLQWQADRHVEALRNRLARLNHELKETRHELREAKRELAQVRAGSRATDDGTRRKPSRQAMRRLRRSYGRALARLRRATSSRRGEP